MTEDEIKALLAIAVAYDNRRPTVANITAWHEQAERNRWRFDDAKEAIHRHFGESTEFLMPAHVNALIRQNRRQPAPYIALERAPGPADEAFAELVDGVVRRAQPRAERPEDPVLAVRCPYGPCGAAPGVKCARIVARGPHKGERQELAAPHPSRRELAGGAQ